MKQALGEWDWYLPPLTLPSFEWYFDWNFTPPPTNIITGQDQFSALGNHHVYNDGVGNLSIYTGVFYSRNVAYNTRRLTMYYDCVAGSFFDTISVNIAAPAGTLSPVTITVRTYTNSFSGIGGLLVGVNQTIVQVQSVNAGNIRKYFACDGSEIRAFSVDMTEAGANSMTLFEVGCCVRGVNPMPITLSLGSCTL